MKQIKDRCSGFEVTLPHTCNALISLPPQKYGIEGYNGDKGECQRQELNT